MTRINSLKLNEAITSNRFGDAIIGALEGPCADLLEGTRNGRVYTRELWDKVFRSDKFNEYIENGGVIGELDHPETRVETLLKEAAIKMSEKPYMKNGVLTARFDILNTPNGQIAKTLAKAGIKLGVSSRGNGETYMKEGKEVVDENSFDFEAFDLVYLPAVKNARMQLINESKRTGLKENIKRLVESANAGDKQVLIGTLSRLDIPELNPLKEEYKLLEGKMMYAVESEDGEEELRTSDKQKAIKFARKHQCPRIYAGNVVNGEFDQDDYELDWELDDDIDQFDKDLEEELNSLEEDMEEEDDNDIKEETPKKSSISKSSIESSIKTESFPTNKVHIAKTPDERERKAASNSTVLSEILEMSDSELDIALIDCGMKDKAKREDFIRKLKLTKSHLTKTIDEDLNKSKKPVNKKRAAASDGAIMSDLQEAIEARINLEDEKVQLLEKLSAGSARETKLKEEIERLKSTIRTLSEKTQKAEAKATLVEKLKQDNANLTKTLESKTKNLIKTREVLVEKMVTASQEKEQRLLEQLQASKKQIVMVGSKKDFYKQKLDETLTNSTKEISQLKESLNKIKATSDTEINKLMQLNESLKKDMTIKTNNYTKKLEESIKTNKILIERLRDLREGYISSICKTKGFKVEDFKSQLPNNFNVNDINLLTEKLQSYQVRINTLPFNVSNKVGVKVNGGTEPLLENKRTINSDADISDALLDEVYRK